MNLTRQPARRLARNQPPLLRQYWLHRVLAERRASAASADESAIKPTERGEATPDDQT